MKPPELSPRGMKLHIGIFLALFCVVMWHRLTDSGVAARVDQWQAEHLLFGRYSAKLTIVLLALAIGLCTSAIGYLHDFVFGLGAFERRPKKRPRNEPIDYQALSGNGAKVTLTRRVSEGRRLFPHHPSLTRRVSTEHSDKAWQ